MHLLSFTTTACASSPIYHAYTHAGGGRASDTTQLLSTSGAGVLGGSVGAGGGMALAGAALLGKRGGRGGGPESNTWDSSAAPMPERVAGLKRVCQVNDSAGIWE